METAFFAVISVLALAKTVHHDTAKSGDFLTTACAAWTLTQDDVRFFFTAAHAVSSEETHLAYDTLPCKYSGTVTLDGRQYRFEINAGSYGWLLGTSQNDASYYGCKDRCARLFPFHVYGDD